MNNAVPVALRGAGICLRSSPWPQPAQCLRRVLVTFSPSRSPSVLSRLPTSSISISPRHVPLGPSPTSIRRFGSTSNLLFKSTFGLQQPMGSKADVDDGLPFQEEELELQQLQRVFGRSSPPTRFANRLLRVLHARRVDGTLDLPVPQDMAAQLRRYPKATDAALAWLRKEYPIDEDGAIVARIDREESQGKSERPSELLKRGQGLALYYASQAAATNYSPQSGNYGARLGEEGNVYGESELDSIRAKNLAEAEKEDEELQQQVDRVQAEIQERSQSQALSTRPDQGLEIAEVVRAPNEYEKWVMRAKNRAQSKLTLDSPEIASRSLISRLFPSFTFVALVCGGCYLYAQYWTPPSRSDRLYPDVSLGFATLAALITTNVVILLAWRFPPAWRILNRYFIAAPGHPVAISMLGNIFSHQSGWHLFLNMFGLLVFGLNLHEDLGRGTFLALYIASGVVGSFTSLAIFASRGFLMTSSLGASGSVWGLTTAYCWIHAYDKFSLILVPDSLRDRFHFQGWMILSLMIVSQLVGLFSPLKSTDYASHIAGIVVGMVTAEWWKRNPEGGGGSGGRNRKPWYRLLPGTSTSKDS